MAEPSSVAPLESYRAYLLDRCAEKVAIDSGPDDVYAPSFMTETMIHLIVAAKDTLQCPWSVALVVVGFGIRALSVPIAVGVERQKRRLAAVSPQTDEFQRRIRQATADGRPENLQKVQQEFQEFRKKYGISLIPPNTLFIFFVQMPIFGTVYQAIKALSSNPELFRQFALETPLWLDSLALPDPLSLLPLMCLSVFLTNFQMSKYGELILKDRAKSQITDKRMAMAEPSMLDRYGPWAIRGGACLVAFLARDLPGGLFLYLLIGFIVQLLVTQICRIKRVERFLDLPSLSAGIAFNVARPPASTSLLSPTNNTNSSLLSPTNNTNSSLLSPTNNTNSSLLSPTNNSTGSTSSSPSRVRLLIGGVCDIWERFNGLVERLHAKRAERAARKYAQVVGASVVTAEEQRRRTKQFMDNRYRKDRVEDDEIGLLKEQLKYVSGLNEQELLTDKEKLSEVRRQFEMLNLKTVEKQKETAGKTQIGEKPYSVRRKKFDF
eukprot:GHVS01088480.1.p1 GENE.GHVS01088480.1~~GHVS01088480.1.p1  ORF type:complete len:535 (+),score=105.35 GHVS01088480.1:127-1605(+)